MLGREQWLDSVALRNFILDCQDSDHGGISDKPGESDVHPLFLFRAVFVGNTYARRCCHGLYAQGTRRTCSTLFLALAGSLCLSKTVFSPSTPCTPSLYARWSDCARSKTPPSRSALPLSACPHK